MTPKPRSRCVVVDTSIARAAGESKVEVSSTCRAVMLTILEVCHRVISTPATREEARRNWSRFSRKWLTSMHARKKVERLDEVPSIDWNPAYNEMTDKQRQIAEKDTFLVEAALATDRLILSLDNEARTVFCLAASRIETLSGVSWLNPTIDRDQVIHWLEEGAKADPSHQLG